MNFSEFVAKQAEKPFTGVDRSLHFLNLDTEDGSFMRMHDENNNIEPYAAWFIATPDGFLLVDEDVHVKLEEKYQAFLKEQE